MDLKAISQVELAEQYLKPYLTEPSADLVRQITAILQQQFSEKQYSEVGGSMFCQPQGLELKVVKPALQCLLETKLDFFEQGIDFDLNFVASSAGANNAYYQKHNPGTINAFIINAVYETLQEYCANPEQLKNMPDDERRRISNLYRNYVMGIQFEITLPELKVDDPLFSGMFHVHKNNSPPSPGDLELNKRCNFANLVISAAKNYQTAGINLHLVYCGSSELLYRGPLEAKK